MGSAQKTRREARRLSAASSQTSATKSGKTRLCTRSVHELHATTTKDEDPEPEPGQRTGPQGDPGRNPGAGQNPHAGADLGPGAAQLRTFATPFTSSPRGARLARRFVVKRMEQWGCAPASDISCSVALLVGELAANAVCHGRVPGRDFALRLVLTPQSGAVRIEVSDAGSEPPPARPVDPGPEDESGRGLLLVDILATRWGTSPRHPVGKTVWAEIEREPWAW